MNRLLAAATLAGSFVIAGAAQTTVRFTEVTREAGVSFHHVNGASPDKRLVETMGSGGLFFDYDNDGWLDLYVTNFGPNMLYRNRGGGTFTDVSAAAHVGDPRWSASCAFADIDNDGDLDLLVTNNGQTADLLRNDSVRGNSLLGRAVVGMTPTTPLKAGTRDAVGARVRVTAGGRTQARDVRAGSSYLGQSDLRVHVGLGDAAVVDRVEVTWPSGRVEVVTSVRANHIVTIQEGRGIVGHVPFVR